MSTRHDDGAVTVEFAVIGLVAFVLLFGLVLLGLHASYSGLAEHGARKAARTAAVRSMTTGEYPNDDEIKAAASVRNGVLGTPVAIVVDRRAGTGSTTVPCTIDGAGGSRRCDQGDVVTVTLTYEAPALAVAGDLIPGVGGAGLDTVTRRASARFE